MLHGADRHIFKKLHIKGGVRVPYSGWLGYDGNGGYTRSIIPELITDFEYKVGAEIGVMNGDYSLEILTKNPSVKMFCVDPWTPGPGSRSTQVLCDRRFRRAQQKLAGFDVTYLRKTSMEALADVPDGSLDFVYIDAIHQFDHVMMDLIGWYKKVRSGGLVSGHDYCLLHDCGVMPAVNAFTWAHDIKYWYVTNEYLASFFWVKS